MPSLMELLQNHVRQIRRRDDYVAWLRVLERLHTEKKQWLIEADNENSGLALSLEEERQKVQELQTVARWLDKEKSSFQKIADECQEEVNRLKVQLKTAEEETIYLRNDTKDLFSALKAISKERDEALANVARAQQRITAYQRRLEKLEGAHGQNGGISSGSTLSDNGVNSPNSAARETRPKRSAKAEDTAGNGTTTLAPGAGSRQRAAEKPTKTARDTRSNKSATVKEGQSTAGQAAPRGRSRPVKVETKQSGGSTTTRTFSSSRTPIRERLRSAKK